MLDRTGRNWLVLLLLAILVLGTCVWIVFTLLKKWGALNGHGMA
jgi:hypothetical protein